MPETIFSFQSNEGGMTVTSLIVWISFDFYEKNLFWMLFVLLSFPFVFSLDLSDVVLEPAILVRSLLRFDFLRSVARQKDFPLQLVKFSFFFCVPSIHFSIVAEFCGFPISSLVAIFFYRDCLPRKEH
jgi:hypothetical protein